MNLIDDEDDCAKLPTIHVDSDSNSDEIEFPQFPQEIDVNEN